nr:MAG TPA: hypothetical protein [Caudoviricetes sp.]
MAVGVTRTPYSILTTYVYTSDLSLNFPVIKG